MLRYVTRKISNVVVHVMGWKSSPRMEENHVPRAAVQY